MNELIPISYKNQRIMTTKVLAEEFGTKEENIKTNFNRNKGRFIKGKHYYQLEGEELKEFKRIVTESNDPSMKFVSVLTLWTDRGAARHAKILDTDEAWEVYEDLEENYFNPKENTQNLNTSELSPELQMFNQMFKAIANNELEQKKMKDDIQKSKDKLDKTKDELQGIREAVLLNPSSWRKDTSSIISKIAMKLGGFEHIRDVREESYKILNEAYKVNIKQRLVNKQKNMALEGCSKSKIAKMNFLDVIEEDSKLLNGYLSIVSKMAIKNGIGGFKDEED